MARRIPLAIYRMRSPWFLSLVTLWVLAIFFFFPLTVLFIEGWRLTPEAPFWKDMWLLRVSLFTYFQATLSALLSVGFGLWAALMYSEQKFLGRSLLWQAGTVCFSFPALLVALALVGFWGRAGWVAHAWRWTFGKGFDFYGWPALLLGHMFFNFPLTLKGVGHALVSLDRETEKCALALGASRWHCFFSLTLRKIYPSLQTAFVLSFLYSAGSFLIVLLLGGGPRFTTLEVAIYRATRLDFDLPSAIRYGSVQVVVCFLVYTFFLKNRSKMTEGLSESAVALYYPRHLIWQKVLLVLFWSFFFMLVAGPLLCFGWEGLRALPHLEGRELLLATWTSLKLSSLTTLFTTLLATALAYASRHGRTRRETRIYQNLAMSPLSVSTVLLSLALSFALPSLIAEWRGKLVLIALIQSLAFLPVVYASLRDGWDKIEPLFLQSAASLGAGPWQTFFFIELPLLKRFFLGAITLAAALSLGEVGTLLMLNAEDLVTLPLWIFRLMGQYQFEKAFSVGFFLLLLFFALELISKMFEVKAVSKRPRRKTFDI